MLNVQYTPIVNEYDTIVYVLFNVLTFLAVAKRQSNIYYYLVFTI